MFSSKNFDPKSIKSVSKKSVKEVQVQPYQQDLLILSIDKIETAE